MLQNRMRSVKLFCILHYLNKHEHLQLTMKNLALRIYIGIHGVALGEHPLYR